MEALYCHFVEVQSKRIFICAPEVFLMGGTKSFAAGRRTSIILWLHLYKGQSMPKFTIDHESKSNPAEAYSKIKDFLNNDQDIRKFDSKLQCSFNDGAMSCKMNGSQFKADMVVAANGAGSKVQVTVDLPLLLTPFKGKVTETLQRKLAKYLG
jgi:hypothetical protein